MSFKIRIATENDFAAIYVLNEEFAKFSKTPEKFVITLEQMVEEQEHFQCLVVENKEGEIIGFVTIFIAWYSWIGKSMYLDDLYVIEKYRRNKVGSQLMDAVFQLARAQNCKKVKWEAAKWNKNAIDFYKKIGAIIDEVNINCDLLL